MEEYRDFLHLRINRIRDIINLLWGKCIPRYIQEKKVRYGAYGHSRFKVQEMHSRQSDGGFTLVELIVVLALMTILITFSAFGVVAWQKNMRYSEANAYAYEIFMAAQDSLTRMSSSGELKALQKRVNEEPELSGCVLSLTNITNDAGEVYGAMPSFPAFSEKIYSFSCSKGEYDTYLAGGTVSPQAEIVFTLISSKIFDKSILNNSICIECTLESGQMFWTIYGEYAESFEYNPSNREHSGIVDICNRTADDRMEKMLGAYYADNLYTMPSKEVSR